MAFLWDKNTLAEKYWKKCYKKLFIPLNYQSSSPYSSQSNDIFINLLKAILMHFSTYSEMG